MCGEVIGVIRVFITLLLFITFLIILLLLFIWLVIEKLKGKRIIIKLSIISDCLTLNVTLVNIQ